MTNELLIGGGEVGDLLRSVDWAKSPLGPVATWPVSLRTMVNLMLGSEVPMFVLWGPELVQLYNHAAMRLLGSGKHPAAMGQRSRDCWAEIWDVVSPLHQQVLAGASTVQKDSLLPLQRNGFLEECYFDYAYSPIRDESGAVAGLLATVAETTVHVIDARRQALLRELTARTASARDVVSALATMQEALAENAADLPFALLYALREDAAELVLCTGLERGSIAAPEQIARAGAWLWPLEAGRRAAGALEVELSSLFPDEIHAGPWPERVERALLVPLALGGNDDLDAVLVVGLSPRLPADERYRDFLRLLSGQVAAQVVRVDALVTAARARAETEAERRRQHDLFMQTPIAIAIVEGPSHRCVFANTVYLEMARRRPVVGQSLLDAVPELRAFGFDVLLDRVLATGEAFHGKEIPLTLQHGDANERFLLSFVYTPIRNASGAVTGVMMCGWDVTELATARRDAEALAERLRLREERYRTVFASIDDGFCLIEVIRDAQGKTVDYRFLETNASFEAQTGLRDADGKTARELVPLLDESWFRLYGRVADTGESARFENHASAMEGRWFDVFASRVGSPERGEVAIVFKDITERKRGEQERAELLVLEQRARGEAETERRKQHDLFMQAPVGIAILEGAEHRFTFANAQYRALIQGRDVVGKTLHEALPDVQGQGFDRLLDQVMTTGEPFVATEAAVQLEHHVGEDRLYLDFTYSPMRNVDGEIGGVLVSTVDITEQVLARRQVESLARQVQRSEAELRLAIDAIPLLVSFVTADERYRLVNTAYEDWFGLTQQALVGRSVRDVIGEAAYAVLGPYVRRALAGERLTFVQYDVPYRHGGVRDVKVTFVPRRDAADIVQGYLAILEDITQQRRVEEERESLFARERVAREEAETASRLKDEFLATVSHELRTPLTAMLGWVQMLRAGSLPPEREARALETIERNARSQAQLIEDLLDLSRILAGKLGLEIKPLDLSTVVEAAIESIRPTAQTKDIRLQPALDTGGIVMGDPDRLQQVVWNLLTNAIKFTPRGGRVQILVECLESSVELTVADTGDGISADFLPHVFERFRQSDGSITRRKGGLGLGLSIVRQLVEMHGGTVSAASHGEGKGATFTVRLPLSVTRRRSSSDLGTAAKPPVVTAERPKELEGLRLLVVDDEEDTREMLGILLGARGATVRLAASAEEGRAAFAVEQPDVIVSDIGMPGENGYAFLASLREQSPPDALQVPVIALTAYARSEDRTRALQAGFESHVAKPVEPDELIAVVASLARRARGRTTPV